MKKIGKQVCFLGTDTGNPRNGEGSFIRLKNGNILYAYTQYYGKECDDHATARIAATISEDEGESWRDAGAFIEKDDDALNIMSVSLLRMNNGDLGVFYLRKFMSGDNLVCVPYLARSSDEGESFGKPVRCIEEDGYFVVNNDRVITLGSGRHLLSFAYHGKCGLHALPGVLGTCYSDDDGQTWKLSKETFCSPYNDCVRLQEPGLYELGDGRVWMWCRTAYGHQYQCFSDDGGESFGAITPAFRFTSPDSPMQVRNVGKYTASIFNPLPFNCLRNDKESWKSPKRTPFVCAICSDRGLSFVESQTTSGCGGFDPFVENCYLLEDDFTNSYCYPAIIEVKDGFLAAYYHSNGTENCLNSTKIIKVRFDELG